MKKQKVVLAFIFGAMMVLAAIVITVCLSRDIGPTQVQQEPPTGPAVSFPTEAAEGATATNGEANETTLPSQSPTGETSKDSIGIAKPEDKPSNQAGITEPLSKPNTDTTATIATRPAESELPTETTNTVVVVGHADPKTGISWDGKSTIIYTYADGTTGTVPKDGATYESLPGIITTYKVRRDSAGREVGTTCDVCGKEVSNQSKGKYCTQFSRESICEYCGERVQAYTCHICKNYKPGVYYCHYCGKVSDDGTNGTCLRWSSGGEHACPNCKETVPAKTCHTCGED